MNRNKRINKLGLTVLALMMAVILYTPVSTMAKGNVSDKRYYAAYNGDGGDTCINSSRAKWDYSSCYIKNEGPNGILCNVLATDRECYEGYNYRTLGDCSVKAYVGVSVGEEKLLQNYVKERGYNYCTIQFAPLSHDAMRYTGLWSPDSVPIRR